VNFRKYRWSRDYESAEEELVNLLLAKRITATRWTADADVIFEPQYRQQDVRLWCVEGSIKYVIDNKLVSMQPGDALDIPSGAVYTATCGFSGCAVYENPDPLSNPGITTP